MQTRSAQPHLYSVDLSDYDVHAEVTGTARSGFMRFRYRRGGPSWIVIQTNVRPKHAGDRGVQIDRAKNEVSGQNSVSRLYAGQDQPAGFRGYFVMQFDHRFSASGSWNPEPGSPQAGVAGAHLSFDLRAGEVLQVRIGTSFTSVAEARKNLDAEIPDWTFDRTVAQAKQAWEQGLGRIQVAGAAPERAVLYTALYHSMLLPRTFSDSDGSLPKLWRWTDDRDRSRVRLLRRFLRLGHVPYTASDDDDPRACART